MHIPYDGGDIGAFLGDAIRNITGSSVPLHVQTLGDQYVRSGVLETVRGEQAMGIAGGPGPASQLQFNASWQVPTSYENRPASISEAVYITY
jgi:hypothetical protein